MRCKDVAERAACRWPGHPARGRRVRNARARKKIAKRSQFSLAVQRSGLRNEANLAAGPGAFWFGRLTARRIVRNIGAPLELEGQRLIDHRVDDQLGPS